VDTLVYVLIGVAVLVVLYVLFGRKKADEALPEAGRSRRGAARCCAREGARRAQAEADAQGGRAVPESAAEGRGQGARATARRKDDERAGDRREGGARCAGGEGRSRQGSVRAPRRRTRLAPNPPPRLPSAWPRRRARSAPRTSRAAQGPHQGPREGGLLRSPQGALRRQEGDRSADRRADRGGAPHLRRRRQDDREAPRRDPRASSRRTSSRTKAASGTRLREHRERSSRSAATGHRAQRSPRW
jgi:Sec-independent protein translocase protein TatA